MTELSKRQRALCDRSPNDYSGLRALFINCTLKRSPQLSHTEGLMGLSRAIMDRNGIATDLVRAVDHDIAPGVQIDMTKHGAASDAWPAIYKKVSQADILVLGTSIWLGDKSSVCTRVIERLYAASAELNDKGQYDYYGKVGGYVIPPQADAGWIGEAGLGPSYLDDGSGGPTNEFTNRNTTFMTWNLMHLALMLKRAGGIPAHGNQRAEWDAGCRFDFENPDYR